MVCICMCIDQVGRAEQIDTPTLAHNPVPAKRTQNGYGQIDLFAVATNASHQDLFRLSPQGHIYYHLAKSALYSM